MMRFTELRRRLRPFRLKYWAWRLQAYLSTIFDSCPPDYDVVFVLDDRFKGWILEAICREIADRLRVRWTFHYSCDHLPRSSTYWFSHYAHVPECLQRNACLWRSYRIVFFTHLADDWGLTDEQMVYALNQADRVILMCTQFRSLLESKGLNRNKSVVLFAGADSNFFPFHERGGGVVGFCSAFYPRKSPDLVLEIVRAMPHRRFLLLGRNWNQYERMAELCECHNFEYVEAPYAEYPRYYGDMDVFVSAATLEGGPIPLLEAMMCNVVPVASTTGFAPDLIEHGKNGFLFSAGCQLAIVVEYIESAFALDTNVRASVEHLTWDRFAENVSDLVVVRQETR